VPASGFYEWLKVNG
jgi:putative SOS response-associated peptidase YedK